MTVDFSYICDVGLRALENQDAVFCCQENHVGLFAIADGMGGHTDGARASRTLTEALEKCWNKDIRPDLSSCDHFERVSRIKKAMQSANSMIKGFYGDSAICGTTAVVLLVEDGVYSVLSCGDSRCYMLRRQLLSKRVVRITMDDVWQNDPEKTKGLSETQIRNHVNYGKLVKAVGTDTKLVCTARSDSLREDRVFLICTDGLYKYVDQVKLETVMKKADSRKIDLKRCVDQLLQNAYESGAPDNVSIVLVRVKV